MSECPLTPRQVHVLEWLSKGKTVGEISEITGRSKNTINGQIKAAFEQAGASNAVGLVAKAIRMGWIN